MEFKLVAPDVNRLVGSFERFTNPEKPGRALMEALDPLFKAMADLAPHEKNDEAKGIWIIVPRGCISDWSSYEDAQEYDDVETEGEYEQFWLDEYPDENEWYYVSISENNPDSRLKFRGLSITGRRDHNLIVNADLNDGVREETWYREEPAIELCKLILPAVEKSMGMLREGSYNDYVSNHLPYPFRTGVIRRSVVYAHEPEYQENVKDGLKDEENDHFKKLITSGVNNEETIGRLSSFTANDFFRACCLGYKACGYDLTNLSPSQAYLKYADGRDEGLTGTGYGLNEGPGIDFDDPVAWDAWYFDRNRSGGHPWEVVPGGNSTHVDLYVMHDNLEWKVRMGEMTQEEADRHPNGYYFLVRGKHRPIESVRFYLAIHDAGLPIVIKDAEEILARYDATDYVGIVPHYVIPKYCEGMFPAKYGRVIDFMHVYEEEMGEYGDQIEWLPEEEAALKGEKND